jgi:hypothetical protein
MISMRYARSAGPECSQHFSITLEANLCLAIERTLLLLEGEIENELELPGEDGDGDTSPPGPEEAAAAPSSEDGAAAVETGADPEGTEAGMPVIAASTARRALGDPWTRMC